MKEKQNADALTPEEKDLLDRLTLQAIANGNTINPQPFNSTSEEYRLLHTIRIKLDLNRTNKRR